VAYTRLKLFQGHEISQSYSASEFEIVPQLSHLPNVLEIGRTCVHPRFRSGKALSILWLNLVPKVLWSMRAKYLMGCVSIHLQDNLARAYHTHQQIQRLDSSRLSVLPQKIILRSRVLNLVFHKMSVCPNYLKCIWTCNLNYRVKRSTMKLLIVWITLFSWKSIRLQSLLS
jgi:hypothetical protein